MKFEEYTDLIDKIVKQPDSLDLFDELREKLKTDSSAFEELTAKSDEMANKINELRDTNLRLYLKVGGEEVKEPEPEPEQDLGELFKESYGHIFNN